MSAYRPVFCLMALFALLFCGCKSDPVVTPIQKIVTADLDGQWMMIEAYKENKPSRMLNKGYFSFDRGQFKTNILGDEKLYPYTLDNNLIRVKDQNNSIYRVSELTSDTLIMTARLMNFNFKFITLKSTNE